MEGTLLDFRLGAPRPIQLGLSVADGDGTVRGSPAVGWADRRMDGLFKMTFGCHEFWGGVHI